MDLISEMVKKEDKQNPLTDDEMAIAFEGKKEYQRLPEEQSQNTEIYSIYVLPGNGPD